MPIRVKGTMCIVALAAYMTSSFSLAAPPSGGGFRGGGGSGGGHPSGGGASHAGGGGAAPRGGGAPAGVSAGAAAGFHAASAQNVPAQTFNTQATINRTPAFTHPAQVAVPMSKFATSSPKAATGPGGSAVLNRQAGPHFTIPQGNNQNTFHNSGAGQFANHLNGGGQFMQHQGFAHPVNPHVYHQAYIGNHAVMLAGTGYRPSYMAHSFYHSPWSGHAWGWGWTGPGYGYGFGGGGFGYGGGWGYGGYGGFGGYGSGLYGGYGPYGYWGRPLGWGFGGWGLGMMAYNSGYYPYYNPYYYPPANQTIVYNYSNPIPVAASAGAGQALADVDDATIPQPVPEADNPDFDAARAAFKDENYAAALASVDAAIAQVPSDSVLHEFRALVLFATRDYKQAAGVIHSLLAVGPGWDWTTMSGLYADPGIYAGQLRALEEYTLAKPKAADAHFLLAYHYTTCSHSDAAALQLEQVVKLMPSDRLAGELLKMIQGPPRQDVAAASPVSPSPDAAAPITPAPPAEAAEPEPIDKELPRGGWTAARPDGSDFVLKITGDGHFTWKYSAPKQKAEEFGGTWSVEGPVLILQRKEGGALAGTATFDGTEKFNFRMVGAPPEDKGLDFSK